MDLGTIVKLLEFVSCKDCFWNIAENILRGVGLVCDNFKTFKGMYYDLTHYIGWRHRRDVLGLCKGWSL